ncbi:MAG: hypothetical protein FWD27_01700 [Coriobacteriia bacterium]|nr:hypothetical protein [Coriobacteriia bacterium]
MASILIINLPWSGHVAPTLPLAEALVKRGHKVSYINAEEYRGQIEKTGAHFIPYQEGAMAHKKTGKIYPAAYDTALFQDEKFDLLIYDFFFFPGTRIAEILGIPSVRVFSQMAWNKQRISQATPYFVLCLLAVNALVMPKRNVKHMGLTKNNRTIIRSVLLDKPALNIVNVPKAFQVKSETYSDDYQFVALPYDDLVDHISSDDYVATSVSQTNRGRIPYDKMKLPIVYVSLGSMYTSKSFLKKCIGAFGNKDLSVVINTAKVPPAALGELPDNIYAYSYVPQLEVLQHVDVFVTHCGANSTNEALYFGVPMVGMPYLFDQEFNANQVKRLGLGTRISIVFSGKKRLYNAVQEVLQSKTIQEQTKAMQNRLKDEGTVEDAVARIEDLLA